MKDSIKNLIKSIPLETRIKVNVEAYFVRKAGCSMIIPVDENGEPDKALYEATNKAVMDAQPLIDLIMEEIEGWRKDGEPK
jgi:hypothetical protein